MNIVRKAKRQPKPQARSPRTYIKTEAGEIFRVRKGTPLSLFLAANSKMILANYWECVSGKDGEAITMSQLPHYKAPAEHYDKMTKGYDTGDSFFVFLDRETQLVCRFERESVQLKPV